MQDIFQTRFVYMAGRGDDYNPQHDYDTFYSSKEELLQILQTYDFEQTSEWIWERPTTDIVAGQVHAKWVCYITQHRIINDLPEVVRLMLSPYQATTG